MGKCGKMVKSGKWHMGDIENSGNLENGIKWKSGGGWRKMKILKMDGWDGMDGNC